MPQVQVREEPERSRYVAVLGDEQVGLAAYEVDGQTVSFTHTEVDPAHRRQGIGGALVEASLADVRRRGQRVVPACPFYRAWFDAHPEATDLLA